MGQSAPMHVPLDDLPCDVEVLHRLVRDMAGSGETRVSPMLEGHEAALEESRAEVERLRLVVKQFQRARFGPRSERLDPDQLQLGLEDLDADLARAEARGPEPRPGGGAKPAHRGPLPEHLPRSEAVLDVPSQTCPCRGGALHAAGESVSEMLD